MIFFGVVLKLWLVRGMISMNEESNSQGKKSFHASPGLISTIIKNGELWIWVRISCGCQGIHCGSNLSMFMDNLLHTSFETAD